jgi:hypothetical protein
MQAASSNINSMPARASDHAVETSQNISATGSYTTISEKQLQLLAFSQLLTSKYSQECRLVLLWQ